MISIKKDFSWDRYYDWSCQMRRLYGEKTFKICIDAWSDYEAALEKGKEEFKKYTKSISERAGMIGAKFICP